MSAAPDDEPDDPGQELVPAPKPKGKLTKPVSSLPASIRAHLPDWVTAHALGEVELRTAVWELYKRNFSADHIAFALDLSRQQVYALLKKGLRAHARVQSHTVEEWVDLELARLDDMEHALQPKVRDGNAYAIQTALKIKEHRAKLKGLYAPERKEIKQSVDVTMESYSLHELQHRAEQYGLPLLPDVGAAALPGEEPPPQLLGSASPPAEDAEFEPAPEPQGDAG